MRIVRILASCIVILKHCNYKWHS